jgi:YbbR domain-containing protein
VQPATIAMIFDKSETGVVPVTPIWEGDPAPGFVVGRISIDPQTVEVVGPASAVRRTTEAVTETLSVEGASDALTREVTIGFVDPAVRLRTPRRATVKVEILPGPRERLVNNRPVYLRNLLGGLTAQAVPPVVDVLLRGSREELTGIAPDEVEAFVDLNGLGVGDYSLTVHVNPSVDAGVAGITPQTVQVSIARARN